MLASIVGYGGIYLSTSEKTEQQQIDWENDPPCNPTDLDPLTWQETTPKKMLKNTYRRVFRNITNGMVIYYDKPPATTGQPTHWHIEHPMDGYKYDKYFRRVRDGSKGSHIYTNCL
jgi:hypothetical protein